MKRFWVTVCVLSIVGALAAGSYIIYYKSNEKKERLPTSNFRKV